MAQVERKLSPSLHIKLESSQSITSVLRPPEIARRALCYYPPKASLLPAIDIGATLYQLHFIQ